MIGATTDTIIALSSPPGRSARGLIRFSGLTTRRIAAELIGANSQVAFPRPNCLTATRLRFNDRNTPTLPILLHFSQKPHSYTGDDLLELQCPGNPCLLERIIHRSLELGARLANPGEFTFRAFLAGKLDLMQAEGVAATIAATSESQLKAASLLRLGELGRFTNQLVDLLAAQLARVEAGIDFVDQEDVVPITPGELDQNLAGIERQLDELLRHSQPWGVLEALPRVVIAGAPSTGKSTLFNAMIGKQRAVTATTAGTTRDLLEEPLALTTSNGRHLELMLTDMAGLDAPVAMLDRQAQAVARRAIDHADLILLVEDGRELADFTPMPVNVPILKVRHKIDLPNTTNVPHDADIETSALTGQGLGQLCDMIAQHLADRAVNVSGQMLALQPRHQASLHAAADHLSIARRLLEPQRDAHAIDRIELVAGSMRNILDQLAALGGTMTPDDVIARVFATFCIGK